MARVVSRRKQREKRIRLRVAASLMDFLGVIGCVALIFLCVTLFRSLFEWINGDFEASFSSPALSGGEYVYMDGTAYGGVVDEVVTQSGSTVQTYRGRVHPNETGCRSPLPVCPHDLRNPAAGCRSPSSGPWPNSFSRYTPGS